MSDIKEVAEQVTLSEFVEQWDEVPKCMSRHRDPNDQYCSGPATHVSWSECDPVRRQICTASAAFQLAFIHAPEFIQCMDCEAPVSEDWYVRPL